MKKIRNIILGISMAALSISLCGCSDSENSSDNSIVLYDDSNSYVNPNDKLSETNAPSNQTTGEMGVKTAFKDCEITLTKVMYIGEIHENTGYAAIFEITNNSGSEIKISALGDFTVKADDEESSGGLTAEASVIARDAIPELQSFNDTIADGETITGYITCQIPAEWSNLKISYTPQNNNETKDYIVYNITPDMITEQ